MSGLLTSMTPAGNPLRPTSVPPPVAMGSRMQGVNPLDLATSSPATLSSLFPSMKLTSSPLLTGNTPQVGMNPSMGSIFGATPGQSPILGNLQGLMGASPLTATSPLGQAGAVRPQAIGGAAATPGIVPDLATRQLLLNAYTQGASPDTPDLNVALLQQVSGNKGISSLALGYGAEIKAAAADIAQNPNTTFLNVTNRSNNPAGLIPFMQFENTKPDKFLEAMMVYKNGTYSGGVLGQYNLNNIANTYERLVGPLTPDAKRAATIDERRGMGLVYRMMQLGVIDPNQEIDFATGASKNGFWDPAYNGVYLQALNAVTSGTVDRDLALEAQGAGGQTLGKVDGFLTANAQRRQIQGPFSPTGR